MISKKRNSKKAQLSRVLSEPELKVKSKSPRVINEDREAVLTKSPKSTHIINLQIPASKPRRNTLAHRPSKHGDDKEAEQIAKDKNSLLAQVTALQREINLVKSENRFLRENIKKNRALEDKLKEAYTDKLTSKVGSRPKWSTIEESMQEFKQVFNSFMIQG